MRQDDDEAAQNEKEVNAAITEHEEFGEEFVLEVGFVDAGRVEQNHQERRGASEHLYNLESTFRWRLPQAF